MHVAIQGELASFHHQAAQEWFGDDVSIVPCDSFEDVLDALDDSDATMAVIAVENSLYGSINEVLDLVESRRYPIVGEVFLRIKQQLIGMPDAPLSGISRVYSHPVALAQCEQYLDEHLPDAERIAYYDTAASVEFIKSKQNPSYAAIAGTLAGKLHELPVVQKDIEDNQANYTRFWVLGARGSCVERANKASLVITTDHTPGALARVLTLLAKHGANLTKLQSRPIVGQPWNYRFYIDIEAEEPHLTDAVTSLLQAGVQVTELGRYASARA